MNHLILMAVIIPISVLIAPSHLAFAYNDPKHCNGYNVCFTVGYNDGYSDAQKGISPAYACIGLSSGWCDGYNDGFRAGNGGKNIFYGQRTDQNANINIHVDNNKISINQQSNDQVGDNRFTSVHNGEGLPNCMILCLNSYIRTK